MKTKQELELETIKQEFQEALIHYRERAGFESKFHIHKVFNVFRDDVSHFEAGKKIPTLVGLYALGFMYKMKAKEVDGLIQLREKIIALGKEVNKEWFWKNWKVKNY